MKNVENVFLRENLDVSLLPPEKRQGFQEIGNREPNDSKYEGRFSSFGEFYSSIGKAIRGY